MGTAHWIKHFPVIQVAGVQTQTQPIFFNSRKIISAPILSVTQPHELSLFPMALEKPRKQVTCYGRFKRDESWEKS